MIKYRFKVRIDQGASGIDFLEMITTGSDFEEASEKVFESLRHEFRNVVAFFDIVDWKRL